MLSQLVPRSERVVRFGGGKPGRRRAHRSATRAQQEHHHLWNSVPWYKYQSVYAETCDGLQAIGARVHWGD